MAELESQLNKLRPSLFEVSPLEAYFILGYGIFNIVIALFLFPVPGRIAFLSYPEWAVIFIFLGVWMLYAIFRNKWPLARASLIAGVLVKSTLLIAVIAMGNWIIASVWGLLTFLQVICYVFFPLGDGHDH